MTHMKEAMPEVEHSAPLRIGTRGSDLALWQARAVRSQLEDLRREVTSELVIIRPEGDRDKTSSLLAIGGRGVFASALQEQLLAGRVDIAVHATKDVPTISPVGLGIAAYPAREDPRDVLISRHGLPLAELPAHPVIGTSSRRRAVQLLALRPDVQIVDLRGNIDTRLRKAATDQYDAIILAAAGITRMGWEQRISEYLPVDTFVPAPGQGALAVESRVAPDPAWPIAAALNDPAVAMAVSLERLFLRTMGGGCTTPVGAHAVVQGNEVTFFAMMASDDGSRLLRRRVTLSCDDAVEAVQDLSLGMRREIAATWTGVGTTADADAGLSGRRVLTTGTSDFAERSAEAFRGAGATATPAVTTVIHPSGTPGVLAAALRDAAAGGFDWLVITSQQTVPVLAEFGADALTGKVRVAVVGDATARALEELGVVPDLVPDDQTGAGLATALLELVEPGQKVLCLLGNRASDEIPTALRRAEIPAIRVESYRSVSSLERTDEIRSEVRAGRIEIVTFASPSAVDVFVRELGVDLAALSGACLVAVGPSTATAMEAHGLPIHAVAEAPSPTGLRDAAAAYFNQDISA
jgi:hydroxymethylbilane synthase